MGEARTDDGTLYFEIYGEGKPLVLVCGLTGSIDYYWHALLADLSSHFQVIVFDTRGVGKTKYSSKGFLLEQVAEDVAHLLDHLGIRKTSIFGHSMGSAIAQAFAKKYPDRVEEVILCNTFPRLNSRDRAMIDGILALLDENIPIKKIFWSLMPWIFSDKHLSDGGRQEKLRQFYAERQLDNLGFRHQVEALLAFDSSKWLDQIQAKTLIVSSKEDIMFPPELGEKMAEKIPYAKYIEVEGGHATHVEQAPLLTSIIKDFIRP